MFSGFYCLYLFSVNCENLLSVHPPFHIDLLMWCYLCAALSHMVSQMVSRSYNQAFAHSSMVEQFNTV